jgi:hypothetical protein
MADSPQPRDFPSEGINTLAAQASRQSIDRIVIIIRRERERGVTEKQLGQLLARSLPDYDEHTRKLLLKLGSSADVPDDFPLENVASSQQVKANTIELTVKELPSDITLFTLVRYQGKQWLIVNNKDKSLTLKAL